MIKNIVILGGGSAGMLTSAMLGKLKKNLNADWNIRCITSEATSPISVGESNLLSLRDVLGYLEILDDEWMKECNATYKTSIRFEDWNKPGGYFHYPLGAFKANVEHDALFNDVIPRSDEFDWTDFAKFLCPNAYHAEYNVLNEEDTNNSSFHFDAKLFGKFIKKKAKELGVEFIKDEFIGISPDEDGNIASLVGKKDSYFGDFFIDCSGFQSLLMRTEHVGWKTYNHKLINEKAFHFDIEYKDKENELKNYTNCVAMKNGWCWEIPLWDRMSIGYVHSNRFATDEEILEELKERYGSDFDETKVETIKFVSGRREKGALKNVVAVGLSYGFIEPLESTGLLTAIKNIFSVMNLLSHHYLEQQEITSFDRQIFNRTVSTEMDLQSEFLQLHYAVAGRSDTPYWRFVRDLEYDWSAVDFDNATFYNSIEGLDGDGFIFILAGNGRCKSPKCVNYPGLPVGQKLIDSLKNHDSGMKRIMEKLPSTYEYLKSKIYDS